MKLSDETSRQCVFGITGGKFSGYYRFKKGLYCQTGILTTFKKIDQTLGYSASAWLDDILLIPRGSKQEQEEKLFDIVNKLEKTGYWASKRKSEFFMNRTKWLGHQINEKGKKTE